jgi:hypothetical protein
MGCAISGINNTH